MSLTSSSSETRFSVVLDAFLATNIERPTQLLKALKIFSKIVKNVLLHPLEMKYRKIPLFNRKIKEVLGSLHGSEEVLTALGFQFVSADKDYWVLDASIDPKLHFSPSQIELLQTCLASVTEMCTASMMGDLSLNHHLQQQENGNKLSAAVSSPNCNRDYEQKQQEGEQKASSSSSSSSSLPKNKADLKLASSLSSSAESITPLSTKQFVEGSSVVSGVPPNSVVGSEGNIGAREYQGKYGGRGMVGGVKDEAVYVHLRKDQLPDRDSMAKLVERRLLKKSKGALTILKKKKKKSGKTKSKDCDDDNGRLRTSTGGGIRKGRIRNFGEKPSTIKPSSTSGSSLIEMEGKSQQKKRFFTASELEEMAKKRYEEPTHFGNVKDMDYIGRLMLNHTNEFRKQNGMNTVLWSQEITDICRIHSKMMGDKRIKFGHDGFKSRVARFKTVGIYHRSAAENVAMNKGHIGYADTAKAAVIGWINSPGHRKNLLSESSNYCGIGVYRNFHGEYYATQIFADVDETQVQIEKRLRTAGVEKSTSRRY